MLDQSSRKEWLGVLAKSSYPRRAVGMGHRRDLGPPLGAHPCDDVHIGAGLVDLEEIGRGLLGH